MDLFIKKEYNELNENAFVKKITKRKRGVELNKKNNLYLIVSLYLNYFFQGIASIIISQNLKIFQNQWGASVSQVTLVVSAIGLGRLLTLNLAGWFSDRFSRKRTVLVGVTANMLFFAGIVFTNNHITAFLVALLAGVGNAFLDTSTYPIVVESFPSENDNSSLSVLNKAFISTGQFILPILIRWTLKMIFILAGFSSSVPLVFY